jgi:hypothetical protein
MEEFVERMKSIEVEAEANFLNCINPQPLLLAQSEVVVGKPRST